MTSPLTPNEAKNWFNTIYSITEQSTPITLVFMLVTGALFAWYTLDQLTRVRTMSLTFYQQLLDCKDSQIAQATHYAEELSRISRPP